MQILGRKKKFPRGDTRGSQALRGESTSPLPHLTYVTYHKNGAKNEEKSVMRDYVSKIFLIDLPADEDYFGDDKIFF